MENFIIAFVGWIGWNVGLFSFTKDEFDETGKPFPIKEYYQSNWDNWIASLVMIPVLMVIGHYQLGMDAFASIDVASPKWSNAYYLGSGFFTEAAKYSYKKWKKSKTA